MNVAQVRTEHERRAAARRAEREDAARASSRVSNGRLAIFALGAVVFGFGYASVQVSMGWTLLPVAAFVGLVVVHERVIRAERRAARAERFWLRGLLRLDDAWSGEEPEGARFADASHPYAADLDLFGARSVFARMSVARTSFGESTLASWLLTPASPAVVAARREAVEEIAPQLDLREELALLGDEIEERTDPATLRGWAEGRADIPALAPALAPLFVVVTIATLAAWGLGWVSGWVAAGATAAEAAFALTLRRQTAEVLAGVGDSVRELGVVAALLGRVEQAGFEAARLRAIADGASGKVQARVEIARLARLTESVDQAANQLFTPFALLLMWRTQHAFALERWRRRAGAHVGAWLDAVGELEALLSLAAYRHERPDDVWPTFVGDDDTRVRGEQVGHPLLEGGGTRNDVELSGGTRLLLVSGSNMSGKSTYLRTVGLSVVLAQCGAPVCARSLELSPLRVGGTLRIQDDLREGASRFFAEISRLKQLFDLAEGDQPLLFLADELLAGTNSHDRRIGAAALLRTLVERGAIGLATTHDLALAAIADDLGERARNVHFADRLVSGQVVFDYTLREGVVERSNALDLMRAVGLPVDAASA
jgi:hypothetical protein